MTHYFAISEPGFSKLLKKPSFKNPYFIVLYDTQFVKISKKWLFQKRPTISWEKRMKEVTNWAKAREQKNTNGTKMCHTNPQKPYFCSVKRVPQKVALFLALEVVLLLTLERLKRGTETNSPAHIYIYIYGA